MSTWMTKLTFYPWTEGSSIIMDGVLKNLEQHKYFCEKNIYESFSEISRNPELKVALN